MKTRELCIGEKQAILRLRKEGKLIRAIGQTLGIANKTVFNILKKKETIGVLSNRHRIGWPRKTTEVDEKKIVRAMRKHPKTAVSEITKNFHRAEVKVSQSTVQRRLRYKVYRVE